MALTTDQFMSQPLTSFVNKFNDRNYNVAKSIAEFFNNRDHGHYAASVTDSDSTISRSFSVNEGKWRKEKDVNGKNICVWKQSIGDNSNKYKEDTVKALARGLIFDHKNDTKKIKEGLEELVGGKWAVCYTNYTDISVYATYNKYFFTITVNGKNWKIWRQS